MAQVPFNPVNNVAPTGAPNDLQRVETGPEDFGGAQATALSRGGNALEGGGDALMQQAMRQAELHNTLQVNDIVTKTVPDIEKAWTDFHGLEGKAALDALPSFLKTLGGIADGAMAQGTNLKQKAMLSSQARFFQQQYARYGAGWANSQYKSYQDNNWSNTAERDYNQAGMSFMGGDVAGGMTLLDSAENAVRNRYAEHGYDPATIDVQVGQTTGKALVDIVDQLVGRGDTAGATALYNKMRPRISLDASRQIEAKLTGTWDKEETQGVIGTAASPIGGTVTVGKSGFVGAPAPIPGGSSAFFQSRLSGGAASRADSVEKIQPQFRDGLASLAQATEQKFGGKLGIFSGYRSVETQAALYAKDKADHSGSPSGMVGTPGGSKHQSGQAADISWNGESLAKAPAAVVAWVHEHAADYGVSFPLNGKDGKPLEVWHAEPVGSRGGPSYAGSPASTNYLQGTRGVETSGRVGAPNPYQFSDSTWATYGKGDRNNPADSGEAAIRYKAANTPVLEKALGRVPTEAELYLAHQQDGVGAAKLLTNPTALAKDLVGIDSVKGNLPDNMKGQAETITAGDFAKYQMGRYSKAIGQPTSKFMAVEAPAGLKAPGNIDLTARPQVKNPDGTVSTVRSMSFGEDGQEILIPTVSADGKRILSNDEAIAQYHQTGQFLGKFDTAQHATAYAQQLHQQQTAAVGRPGDLPMPSQARARTITFAPLPVGQFGLPDKGARLAEIEKGYEGDPAGFARAKSALNSLYSDKRAENTTEMTEVKSNFDDTLKLTMNGYAAKFDEERARFLFPPVDAERMITEIGIAKQVGQAINGLATATPQEIAQEDHDIKSGVGKFALDFSVPKHGPTDLPPDPTDEADAQLTQLRFRGQAADMWDKALTARELILKGNPVTGAPGDPAAYLRFKGSPQLTAARSDISAALQTGDVNALRAASENYHTVMAVLQDQVGIPPEKQHLLTRDQAAVDAKAAQAPNLDIHQWFEEKKATWGNAFSSYFNDLATLGGLPAEYQSVAMLDANNAKILARAIQDTTKTDNPDPSWKNLGKEEGGKDFNTLISDAVDANPDVAKYIQSMRNGLVPAKTIDQVINSVKMLAFGHKGYGLNKDYASAVTDAVKAFTGDLEYVGSAAVPKAVYDNVTSAIRSTLDGFTPQSIAVPAGFDQPGGTTGEDYVRMLRTAPSWVTVATGVQLLDFAGRPVNYKDGKPVIVRFDTPAGPVAPVSIDERIRNKILGTMPPVAVEPSAAERGRGLGPESHAPPYADVLPEVLATQPHRAPSPSTVAPLVTQPLPGPPAGGVKVDDPMRAKPPVRK